MIIENRHHKLKNGEFSNKGADSSNDKDIVHNRQSVMAIQ